MIAHSLAKRERALSLWIRDRLHERPAVEWGADALKRIHGDLASELVNLFAFLDQHARQQSSLDERSKKVWRLFHIAARDSAGGNGMYWAYELREQLRGRNVQPETSDKLVDLVRPRLQVEKLSPWAEKEEGRQDDPLRWVAWTFKTRSGSLNTTEARLGRKDLTNLPVALLLRIIERGTDALADAYMLAGELGWIERGLDLPNLYVHRVAPPDHAPVENTDDDDDDDDERDPDAYDDHFAPLVRILSGAFENLVRINPDEAARTLTRWDGRHGGLFLRLAAFALWHEGLKPANEVAAFVKDLAERPFWRWMSYPEIATLRASRWSDLPSAARSALENRLFNGPTAEAFSDDADIEAARQFHRDHELARILDAGGDLSEKSRNLVAARRATDKEFPSRVPTVEPGAGGVRVSTVREGNAGKFDDVPADELLEALLQSAGQRHFGQGDDAEAFGRRPAGKARILEALNRTGSSQQAVDRGWQLLLSYPPNKADDPAVVRNLSEGIIELVLREPETRIATLTDRLCYWLDQADEVAPALKDGERLWQVLLPLAADLAREREHTDTNQPRKPEVDLTSAALNEPLGHLISMFLRRCPQMPRQGPRPSMPDAYAEQLKGLKGRARELVANRLAVHMGYFALADSDWLETIVLAPMASESPASDRLWEAFTKYGHVPPPEIWSRLEPAALRRLASGKLSPDAINRLTEMAIVVWSWSKEADSPYSINTSALRSTLTMANDDVRSQAAWYFQSLFRGSKAKARSTSEMDTWSQLGKAFFAEIWPLEPPLQSSKTANHFANIPTRAGEQHFVEAVETILPLLRNFDVWSVSLEFGLGKEETLKLAERYPESALRLLAASINPQQSHRVLELSAVLDQIVSGAPQLRTDSRVRALRRLVHD